MKTVLRSKKFQQLVGFLVSAVIIGWMVMSLEWSKVFEALKTASLIPFIPSLLIVSVHFALRSWRWRYLLPESENPPTIRTLFDSMMAGNFASYVLPLRAGEFVRPFLLARQSTYPFPTAFISVVIERFFDLATVLLSFAFLLTVLPNLDPVVAKGAAALGVMAAAILFVMIAGIFLPYQLLGLVRWVGRKLPPKAAAGLERFTENLLHGLTVLRRRGNLIRVVLFSILIWLSCYLLFYAFLYCFNIQPTFIEGMAVSVITALAVAAPSAPGFIGVYQAGCILALKSYGVNEEVAAAYGILTHIFHYTVTVGYGLFLLNRYHLSMRQLSAPAAAAE